MASLHMFLLQFINIQMFIQETSCTHEEVLLSLLLLKDIS